MDEKWNLTGGVIIIGSLLWDNKNKRDSWRKENFQENPIKVELPIRYGRRSSSRNDTFTMVYSNDFSEKLGSGYILKYKEKISNFNELYRQAVELAKVEGIYKENNEKIFSSWGIVAILLNSKLDQGIKDEIEKEWRAIYQNKINPSCFRVNDEIPSIDENGFLNLQNEIPLKNLDYLLATPVEINVSSYPKPIDIAQTMMDNRYCVYFCRNREHGICTFQDEDIYKNLEEYLKN